MPPLYPLHDPSKGIEASPPTASDQRRQREPDYPMDFLGVLRKELETLRPDRPSIHDTIADAHEAELSGVAFSGGGIRSATFNLGVLQALASLGILEKFDYLSTVSGGGYIGCWLTAWLRREIEKQGPGHSQKGFQEVMDAIGQSVGTFRTHADGQAARPEPRPIAHLREFSNYLTPRKGLWGTDTWTVALAYLRNFALTLSVLVGALIAVVLWVRGAVVLNALMLRSPSPGVSDWVYWLFIAAMATTAFASSRDLQNCRSNGGGRRMARGCTNFSARLSICMTIIATWLGAGVLWQQKEPFLAADNVAGTISAFVVALAIVLGFGLLGAWSARGKTEASVDRGASPQPPSPEPLALGFARAFSALLGALVFFAAVWAICRWFNSWTGEFKWLGSASWAAVMAGPPLMLAAFSLFAVVFIGLSGRDLEELEREWLARIFAAVTKWTVLFCLLTAAVILTPMALAWLHVKLDAYPHGILGALWAGISAAGAWLGRSGKEANTAGWAAAIRKAVMAMAPVVFIAGLLIILIALLNRWFGPLQSEPRLFWACLGYGCLALGATLAWSWRVGVNTFSLHALYGNRLIRAYLGASNFGRRHHPFTGFDLDDNKVRMADLAPDGKNFRGPYLLVNAAINLVHATRLAWQQRKAGAFLFSPLYCGYEFPSESEGEPNPKNNRGGYVPSKIYADGRFSKKGISLGKAMTISGAAASPNMGYRTSPALAFLMTVFNVRLGWWLPNTGRPDGTLWRKHGPSAGLLFLARELLGLTDAGRKYAYISDGGHFENLGIYELVRRRCRYILVCDAEEDVQMAFGGLGLAIERCRTDFGIPIDIDVSQLRRDPGTGLSRWHCAVGRIRYGQADAGQPDGILVYLKASLIGDEPRDVATYAAANPGFPHQSTADQWFDEVQFESYRALGHHIAASVLATPVQVVRRNLAAKALSRKAIEREILLKELFTEVSHQWYPHVEGSEKRPGDHDLALGQLLDALRTDPHLAFLDWQLYPDLGRTVRKARLGHRVAPWVPNSYEELRAGFFFCRRLVQFMQQLFHDLRLDIHYDAPSHRGWMSLLQRWSLSRMVRYTWSMSAGCYSTRFQTFCAHHLRLEVDEISWAAPLEVDVRRKGAAFTLHPAGPPAGLQPEKGIQDDPWRQSERAVGLDFFETQLAREYMRLYCGSREKRSKPLPACFQIFPLQITTEDPTQVRRDAYATITVGFAIVQPAGNPPDDRPTLLYLRIRPAMRRMGLARKAMLEMAEGRAPLPSQVTREKIDKMVPTEEHWHRRIYLEIYPEQEQQLSGPRRRMAEMINRDIAKFARLSAATQSKTRRAEDQPTHP